MRTTKQLRARGFTLVELMIVVAIIGLLTAVAVPNFVKARENSQKNSCLANLKQIEAAISSWGLEKNHTTGDPIVGAELFGATGYIRVAPTCPGDNQAYTLGNVGDSPQVKCTGGLPGHTL
jgi:prepilin-type N-terminal cleavage/methylation domain-containing protein